MKIIRNTFFENSACQSQIIHDPWCEILHTKAWPYAEGDPSAFPGKSGLAGGVSAVYLRAEVRWSSLQTRI